MNKVMTECCCTNERRSFIGKGWLLIKIWAAGVIMLPVVRFVNYRVPSQPLIIKVNRTLKKGGFIMEPDFIIFDAESGPVAVSRKCTHLGCRLNYHEIDKIMICPCHQSRFSREGKRLGGPAEKDLPLYAVEVLSEANGNTYLVTVI